MTSAWNRLVQRFANVGFGVSLLALWGVLTLIGVVIDQGKDADYYAGAFAPPLARLILRLDLNNIYHSAGYIIVVGLILCSMGAATFVKVIPRRMPRHAPVKIAAIPLHAFVRAHGTPAAVRERVAEFFAEHGFAIRKREFGGEEWTFADKNGWARRGVIVAHIGFTVIAIGTTIYWAFGYSGDVIVRTGQTVTLPRSNARITLNDFAYRFDPIRTKAGIVYQPIDYVSHASIVGKSGVTQNATIRVNHPYDIDGVSVYQASYGHAAAFRLTKDGHAVPGAPTEPLLEGDAFPIPGTTRALQYTRFVGTINRATGQPGPDPRANDPGVVLSAFDGDTPVGSTLAAFGKPIDLGGGYLLTPTRMQLYSGFQYRYDPGVLLVGLGAFILLAGLCISFYVLPARLFVQVTDVGDGESEVGLAATTVKGYDVFEDRFAELVSALRATPA